MDFTPEQQDKINTLVADARREGEAKAAERTTALLEAREAEHKKALEQARGLALAIQRTHAASRAIGTDVMQGAEDIAPELFLRHYQVDIGDDGSVRSVQNREGETVTMTEATKAFRESHGFLFAARGGAGVTRPTEGSGAAGAHENPDHLLVEGWKEGA